MKDESPRGLVLGTLGHHWNLGANGLAELLAKGEHGPGELTDGERERLASADLAAAPPHVQADVPEWLAPHFERLFGAEWTDEGRALALRPPLDMRVNGLKAEPEKVQKALARFAISFTPYGPNGLRIAPTERNERHPNVMVEPAFAKGWFEIQDEGSQVAALMVGARPGEQVLDLCAGAGGKTLALAAAMANKGQVHATDSDRMRLAPIFERLKRAGARNVQVREAGASLDDLANRMDAVLVDAPCTGTGVWRRRPDAKWRLSERALTERMGEQAALLTQAAAYVKPGGRLVYVTCSLLPDENEDQVARFAGAMPDWTVRSGEAVIAGSSLAEDRRAALAAAALSRPAGLVLTPRRTGTDGFFIAVIEKPRG
jgi:16S rRNA (cytosine967-C5)-methyltransferase